MADSSINHKMKIKKKDCQMDENITDEEIEEREGMLLMYLIHQSHVNDNFLATCVLALLFSYV